MNKICTDIIQSKKLIELGIDINIADMGWNVFVDNTIRLLPIDDWDLVKDGSGNVKFYPAWSLSALLGLMPTDNKKDEYYVTTESHSDYYIVSYKNCWDGCIHSEDSEESLLDAAFEMVVWLLENGKI